MKHVVWVLSICSILIRCNVDKTPTIQVAAAANTQFALTQIAKAFTDSTGYKVDLIFGASGKLTTQLIEGAPYDIFLAANMEYPLELHRRGLAVDSPLVYANGQLVMWSADANFPVSLENLNKAQNIAVGNPQIAPYGLLTLQILEEKKLWDKVHGALVFGESISQVNQYIESGAAKVGFTAKSIVLTPEYKNVGNWIDVPSDKYILRQGVVQMKSMQNTEIHKQFMAFLFSPTSKKIFLDYGYTLPNSIN